MRLPLAFALISAGTFAQAQASSDDMRTAMIAEAESYAVSMNSGDWQRVISEIPPGLIALMAAEQGMEIEALRQMLTTMSQTTMENVVIEEFSFDIDNATFGVTSEGRDYALFPTEVTVILSGSEPTQTSEPTLMIADEGELYFLSLDSPAAFTALVVPYPDLADIDLGG